MESWNIVPILAVIFIPLLYLLNYFGFLVTHANIAAFRADFSFPTRWEGKFVDTSGYMQRNFVVFRKYNTLAVEIESTSGTLEFEIKGPDGSILSPASGTYGSDSSALIDVRRFRRCSAALRMEHFCGKFHISLQ